MNTTYHHILNSCGSWRQINGIWAPCITRTSVGIHRLNKWILVFHNKMLSIASVILASGSYRKCNYIHARSPAAALGHAVYQSDDVRQIRLLGLFLPTRINSNTSIDNNNNHMPSKLWGEITYTFPNVNGGTVNFVNGEALPSHTVLWIQLLIQAGIKVDLC